MLRSCSLHEFYSFRWQDGNTCAHIAALQGSVDVVRELMRHNRNVVINGKNRVGESTPLHLAAEGGHSNLVRFLIENGASPKAENAVSASSSSTYTQEIFSVLLNFFFTI